MIQYPSCLRQDFSLRAGRERYGKGTSAKGKFLRRSCHRYSEDLPRKRGVEHLISIEKGSKSTWRFQNGIQNAAKVPKNMIFEQFWCWKRAKCMKMYPQVCQICKSIPQWWSKDTTMHQKGNQNEQGTFKKEPCGKVSIDAETGLSWEKKLVNNLQTT